MDTATRETEIGINLPEVTKAIDQPMIDRYGVLNGDINTIHYDKEFAQKCGFQDTIAHGLMTFGFVSEVMTRFLGRGWVNGGAINLTFIAPVHPGDTITTKGKVKEKHAEGEVIRVVAEVWCEKQNGEKVLVGEASGLVT